MEEKLRLRQKLFEINKVTLFFTMASMVLYILDIMTNLTLGIVYLVDREWIYAALTIIFVVSSALYNLLNPGATW